MYDESKMASSTGQKTRELYYEKQAFGHFKRFNCREIRSLFYYGGFERQTRRVGLILTKSSFDKDLRSRCFDRFRQFADQVVIFIPLFRN